MALGNWQQIPFIEQVDLKNKKVLVRFDFNVPIKNNQITDPARILAAKKTLDFILKNDAKVIILSHLSRVKAEEDITSGKKSLVLVAKYLQEIYPNNKVVFEKDNRNPQLPNMIAQMNFGDILLLENTRYNDFDLNSKRVVKLESKCNMQLAQFWASLADVFVNDAFATIHRKHASNYGIGSSIKTYCIGYLIQNELKNISQFESHAQAPVVSIIGGAKVSDKIILLNKLASISDYLLIGGGMCFTFLKALGKDIGTSLCEEEMLNTAKELIQKYGSKIILPTDINATNSFADIPGQNIQVNDGLKNLMGLDIGTDSIKKYVDILSKAKTIFWNGPLGVFEFNNYVESTKQLAKVIVDQTNKGAFSLIGGGDTASAAVKFYKKEQYSFVSTGGGATLSVLQGDELPGLFCK